MLWYTIVATIQYPEFHIVSKFLKDIMHYKPSSTFVMIQQTTHILKQKNLRLCLFYNSGKLIEKCTPCILKAQAMSNH